MKRTPIKFTEPDPFIILPTNVRFTTLGAEMRLAEKWFEAVRYVTSDPFRRATRQRTITFLHQKSRKAEQQAAVVRLFPETSK